MPNVIVVRNDYPDTASLERVIKYVQRSQIGGGYAIDPSDAFNLMLLVKQAYRKTGGVQLKHFIISFSDYEIGLLTQSDLLDLGFEIGMLLKDYQMIYSIHCDSDHTHMHFVFNTVNFRNGRKYSDGMVSFKRIFFYLKEKYPQFHVGLFESRLYSESDPYTRKDRGYFQDMNS